MTLAKRAIEDDVILRHAHRLLHDGQGLPGKLRGMLHGITGGPMGLETGGTAIQSATLGHTQGIAHRVKWHQQATSEANQEICRP